MEAAEEEDEGTDPIFIFTTATRNVSDEVTAEPSRYVAR